MENQKLNFNADQKAVVERELNLAFGTLSTLLDWVKTDALTEDMRESLPGLVDSYMSSVKKAIGFTGEESERSKDMTRAAITHYRDQISDLEKALVNQGSIDSIPANTKLVFEKIDKWWDIEGFNYASDKNIAESGAVRIKLGFMLNSHIGHYSDTPVSDKITAQTKVQYLIDKGFEFTPRTRGYGLDLLDTDTNRHLLHKLVQDAFPSAKIWAVENRLRPTHNDEKENFIIRSLDVTIFNVSDVESLVIEEKHFLMDDED